MSKIKGLSLRVQWLGSRLKKARQDAGYTLDDAAAYLEVAGATVSRFEKGTMKIRRPYLKDLIDFYGIDGRRERAVLFQLSEDAWRKDWWDGETSDLETGFLDYTWLEARASRVCAFEPLIIHGLIQTEDYARSVLSRSPEEPSADELSRLVELRRVRQRILEGDNPTRLSILFEEPALRRPIGGPRVHKEQLEYLLSCGRRPNVDIRVLPMSASWDPGHAGPFTIFELPDPYPHVAFTEGVTGRTFYEAEDKVTLFQRTYDEIEGLTLDSIKSHKLIHTVIKELE